MGRQPFGLASPAAWLRAAGHQVSCADLSQHTLDEDVVRAASLIAFYLPMHTATRIASSVIQRVRIINPEAALCAFGLYAPLNAEWLRQLGVTAIFGGEFEQPLAEFAGALEFGGQRDRPPEISMERLEFMVPDRTELPPLRQYARLVLPDGSRRVVGYTEATRGCKHLCRHCPIVPIYQGKFRVVQRHVVLEDIRRQVAAGAQHITFGDPDFFNGVTHAIDIVTGVHREFPALTYDVTVKVEHLLRHARQLPVLRDTGCSFVTSAVESLDDRVLEILDKGHTRADFLEVVRLFRDLGLGLAPTFVAFTPWTTLESYGDLLDTIAELELVDNVAPVQWAIRLLITSRSRLLEHPEVAAVLGEFDQAALSYRWVHPDPRVDALQADLERLVQQLTSQGCDRQAIFSHVRHLAGRTWADPAAIKTPSLPPVAPGRSRATVPYLTEPWYC